MSKTPNKTLKAYVAWATLYPKLASIVGDRADVIAANIKRPLAEVVAMQEMVREG